MGQGTIAKNVTIGQISLNQGNLFHTLRSLLILVERTPEGFETRNDSLPRILRKLLLGGIVWCDGKLNQDICNENQR